VGRGLCLLAACVLAGGAALAWLHRGRAPQPAAEPFPLPPYSESAFLNTAPDARYVGTAACAECHHANHRSYLLTDHSRALADVSPADEPPDGSFEHKLSGRSYRVYRRDGQLRHEEVLRSAEGQEITRVDLPLRYRVGSGHFTRSYLVEQDGFLHESPITWYTATRKWGMSPGYDFPHHWGFDRPVVAGCVACHAGRVEAVEGTLHRLAIREQAIGCESCHGPGSLHVALYRGGGPAPGEEDRTIVNPRRLARDRQEAVCASCHLNGPASVALRGRRPGDFRPGMPLTDYRTDYRFEGGDEQMTVTGHVTQLHLSACYQKSEDMTCVTCHDPHAKEKPKDPVAYYRQRCLSCHDVAACGLAEAERRQKDAADNCVACHMARGDTEIPHIAFTSHRIVRKPSQRPADLAPGLAIQAGSSGRVPDLVPTDDDSHLPPLDRQRNLGLAYHAAFQNPAHTRLGYAETFRERARELLEGVEAAGLHEPQTAVALAEVYWGKDRDGAAAYARQALKAADATPEVRVAALRVLAGADMQEGEYDSARKRLEELVRRERSAEDWYFLGLCHLRQGRPAEALPPLRQALAIRPDRFATHAALAEVCFRLGDTRRAQEHRDKAAWLRKNRPE
jgi:tetratricopeptide (TPR) repeat protein